ncbi:zinc-binding dehydrogenase [bacterium]|nr:zinc-binding dehydrogenase [bacterium]
MQACYITQFGSRENIFVGPLPDPKPSEKQVLIRIKAASLNHLDIWVRMGRPGNALPFPHILGSDCAGVVEYIGKNVSGVKVGDEVIVYPGINYKYYTSLRSSDEPYGILGLTRQGVFAEYVAVEEDMVFFKPSYLTFQEASALPITYVTAWRMLFTKGALQSGQTVLIHGIGGGVAQAALALALIAGARVIVTSSSDKKLEKARMLGAHYTLNYSKENISEHILEITHGIGVDLVVDAVGAATMPVNIECTRRMGKITVCGVTTGHETPINLQAVYWKQLQIFGSTMGSQEEFHQVLNTLSLHKAKPVIDSEYPLEHVQKATQIMEEGTQFGKIILKTA